MLAEVPDNKRGPDRAATHVREKRQERRARGAGLSPRREGCGGAAGWEAEMDGGDGDKTVAGEAEGKTTQNGNMILA